MGFRSLIAALTLAALTLPSLAQTQQTPINLTNEINNTIITNQSGSVNAADVRQVLNDFAASVPLLTALYPVNYPYLSYTMAQTDQSRLIDFTSSVAPTITLPQPGSNGLFQNGWWTIIVAATHNVTLNPYLSTINGYSSYTLAPGGQAILASNGSNYTIEVLNTGAIQCTGWVFGNGSSAPTCSSTIPLSNIAGLGANVATAAALGTETSGGFLRLNGSFVNGDCPQFSATGLQDSGSPCGGGSSGLTVGSSGIANGTDGYILAQSSSKLAEIATTGTGNVVLATSPSLITPNLDTPSAITLTNGTGLPILTGISGLGSGVASALTYQPNIANGLVSFLFVAPNFGYPVTSPTYGAACNGSTDDSTAITAAVTAAQNAGGGHVIFPAGRACLFATGSLPVTASAIVLEGDGNSRSATIEFANGASDGITFTGASGNDIYGDGIRNLLVTASAKTGGSLVNAQYVGNFLIDDVQFNQFWNGIYLSQTNNVELSFVTMTAKSSPAGSFGIYWTAPSGNRSDVLTLINTVVNGNNNTGFDCLDQVGATATLRIAKVGTQNCNYGFRITDPNNGNVIPPGSDTIEGFESDNNIYGLSIEAGQNYSISDSDINARASGGQLALQVLPNSSATSPTSNVRISNSNIHDTYEETAYLEARNINLSNVQIYDTNKSGSNTAPMVEIGPTASNVTLSESRVGAIKGNADAPSYNIQVDAGATGVILSWNNYTNSTTHAQTGTINDLSGVAQVGGGFDYLGNPIGSYSTAPQVSFTAPGTDAVPTTLQAREQNVVYATDYGASASNNVPTTTTSILAGATSITTAAANDFTAHEGILIPKTGDNPSSTAPSVTATWIHGPTIRSAASWASGATTIAMSGPDPITLVTDNTTGQPICKAASWSGTTLTCAATAQVASSGSTDLITIQGNTFKAASSWTTSSTTITTSIPNPGVTFTPSIIDVTNGQTIGTFSSWGTLGSPSTAYTLTLASGASAGSAGNGDLLAFQSGPIDGRTIAASSAFTTSSTTISMSSGPPTQAQGALTNSSTVTVYDVTAGASVGTMSNWVTGTTFHATIATGSTTLDVTAFNSGTVLCNGYSVSGGNIDDGTTITGLPGGDTTPGDCTSGSTTGNYTVNYAQSQGSNNSALSAGGTITLSAASSINSSGAADVLAFLTNFTYYASPLDMDHIDANGGHAGGGLGASVASNTVSNASLFLGSQDYMMLAITPGYTATATATASWSSGAITIPVGTCPTGTEYGEPIVDTSLAVPAIIGHFFSCSGGTITLRAITLSNSAGSTDVLHFVTGEALFRGVGGATDYYMNDAYTLVFLDAGYCADGKCPPGSSSIPLQFPSSHNSGVIRNWSVRPVTAISGNTITFSPAVVGANGSTTKVYHDDSQAVINAVAAIPNGGVVKLSCPSGGTSAANYNLSRTVLVQASVEIAGDTGLCAAPNFTGAGDMFDCVGTQSNTVFDCGLRNLGYSSNNNQTLGLTAYFNFVDTPVFSNVKLKNFYSGVIFNDFHGGDVSQDTMLTMQGQPFIGYQFSGDISAGWGRIQAFNIYAQGGAAQTWHNLASDGVGLEVKGAIATVDAYNPQMESMSGVGFRIDNDSNAPTSPDNVRLIAPGAEFQPGPVIQQADGYRISVMNPQLHNGSYNNFISCELSSSVHLYGSETNADIHMNGGEVDSASGAGVFMGNLQENVSQTSIYANSNHNGTGGEFGVLGPFGTPGGCPNVQIGALGVNDVQTGSILGNIKNPTKPNAPVIISAGASGYQVSLNSLVASSHLNNVVNLSPGNGVVANNSGSTMLTAPTISSCGTTPPAALAGSTNYSGQVTTGTGSPTACTVTFAIPYQGNAFCTVSPIGYTGTYDISSQSASGFTVTLGTGTSSLPINYACSGP